MIRRATVQDHPAIVELAALFWRETAYDDPFDPDHVLVMVEMAQEHELLYVLEVDGKVEGFAAAICFPLLGNRSVLQVTELAYWINPARRGRWGLSLIDTLERGAEAVGAKYINMIAMDSSCPEIAERIYARRGYRRIETTYCKTLGE